MVSKSKLVVVAGMVLGGALFSPCSAQTVAAQELTVPQLGKTPVEEVVRAMTIDEKVNLIIGFGSTFTTSYSAAIGNSGDLVPGAAGQTNAIPRLGIPTTVLADGPAGLRINPTREGDPDTYYCTHFPIGTLLASTWNLPLVEKVGEAMGDEVRQYGVDVLLAPGVNIHRNPLCGRNFEYYSEDPLLAGETAAAMISGIQKNGVGTSLKHFVANNQETNRSATNAVIDTRTLREIYLKPFEIAVKKAQPWTIMTSYNKLNGTYTAERADLITELLRGEWGFKGVVMTDWYGGRNFPAIINSGNDMIQPGHPMQVAAVKKAIRQGDLRMDIIDENVPRILQYIMQTPRFKGYVATNKPDLKAHAQLTREAAAEGMVLLKNEKMKKLKNEKGAYALPLNPQDKIALFGNTSYDFLAGGNGSGDVNRAYTVSLTEGLQNAGIAYDTELAAGYQQYIADEKAKQGEKQWFDVQKILPERDITLDAARQYARTCQTAIFTIGRSSGEGHDRKHDDYYLTDAEFQALKNVCTAFHQQGKRVVVVLNVPGVIETASWSQLPDAILLAWMGGQEGGNSVADVLTGKVSPSGKLTMSWPVRYSDVPSSETFVNPDLFTEEDQKLMMYGKPIDLTGRETGFDEGHYDEGIYVGYRYYDTKGIAVSYPFGYGLSYTTFKYGKPTITKQDGNITVTLDVKNTGKAAGKEVVQVYVSAPGLDMDKPAKELKGFAKTRLLNGGETETVSITIPENSLASFNAADNTWVLENGTYQVRVAASAADIRYSLPIDIEDRITEQCRPILQPEEK